MPPLGSPHFHYRDCHARGCRRPRSALPPCRGGCRRDMGAHRPSVSPARVARLVGEHPFVAGVVVADTPLGPGVARIAATTTPRAVVALGNGAPPRRRRRMIAGVRARGADRRSSRTGDPRGRVIRAGRGARRVQPHLHTALPVPRHVRGVPTRSRRGAGDGRPRIRKGAPATHSRRPLHVVPDIPVVLGATDQAV